ncbi:RadC-like JAB domain-containing protein [Paenibacillus sp. 1_12]|nr:RadC-like JAB domain-containing protein [Paenibacillus sp. 1_12]
MKKRIRSYNEDSAKRATPAKRSGEPSPSVEDIELTERLRDSGTLLGIELLDHVILGDGNFLSMKEQGLM